MKTCESCGRKNFEDAEFCTNCGVKFKIVQIQPTMPVSAPMYSEPMEKKRKRSNSTKSIIMYIVLIVIIAVVGSILYSLLPNFVDFIISIIMLLIFLSCVFKLLIGSIVEIRDKRKHDRRKRNQNKE